jgi:hypothetical protein
MPDSRKPSDAVKLQDDSALPAHYLPTDTRPMPSDLALIVDAWVRLPESVRTDLVALVRAGLGTR